MNNLMEKHPETNLTYQQMIEKRQAIWNKLLNPKLSIKERYDMRMEHDKLTRITMRHKLA